MTAHDREAAVKAEIEAAQGAIDRGEMVVLSPDVAAIILAALATPPTAEAALPEGWRPIMVVTAEEERCPTCGRTDHHAHYWNDPRYHKAPR